MRDRRDFCWVVRASGGGAGEGPDWTAERPAVRSATIFEMASIRAGSWEKISKRSDFSIWMTLNGEAARMVAERGWPVRADISPKKSPAPRVATLLVVAG